MKRKYDIIYSIGHDCACAMYLQRHNLRRCAGPMDWITGISAEHRFNMILEKFPDFMRIDDMEFVQKNPTIVNDDKCDYYRNNKTGFYFYHDFPTGIPISKSFDNIMQKYNRRINRFIHNIKQHRRVLLVWFSHYHKTSDEQWINFSKQLHKRFNKNIDILIIQHTENQHIPIRTQVTHNIVKYDLHTIATDKNGNITTLGDEQLCNKIFDTLSLRMTARNYIKYIANVIVMNTACKFLPIKSWRHRWRNQIQSDIRQLL